MYRAFSAEIYWSNSDWPQNNVAAWRSNAIDETNPYSDGKWRMFLFDTESGQGLYGSQNNSANANCFQRIAQNRDDDLSAAFTKLLKDEKFALEFARTYMDIANYNFDTEKTTAEIDKFKNLYSQQILDTYDRYPSNSDGKQKLESEYNTVMSFYKNRYSTAESTMRNACSLKSTTNTVTVQNDISSGSVKLNTLTLKENKWSGKYHSDYDMNATAQPNEGASFDHWEITGAELTSGSKTSPTITFKATGDVTIKAVYSGGASNVIDGDFNGDTQVNVADLVLLNQYLLGKKVTIANADIIKDGVIDTFDLVELRKMLTK